MLSRSRAARSAQWGAAARRCMEKAYCSRPIEEGLLKKSGTLEVDRAGLRQHAEAAGDLLVGLLDAAHVAAEAVLVQLLVGRHVPQAAGVRADLVGQHDAHLLVVQIGRAHV